VNWPTPPALVVELTTVATSPGPAFGVVSGWSPAAGDMSAVTLPVPKTATPTSSTEPSLPAAVFRATTNCCSHCRIGEQPVPPPPEVLPEPSIT
jgi:hypothetical protein